jgi:hypothetical protein
MIDRLIKIAGILDRNGHEEDADFVTGLLVAYKKAQLGSLDGLNQEHDATNEIEIPQEELDLLQQVFSALGNSLGKEEGEAE